MNFIEEGIAMELLQMKYYKAVVEAGSINGAAKVLRMTQPPVSMQIRLLEKELGCTLFARGNRKIKLTEEGKIFYDYVVRILNMTESATTSVLDCHTANMGTLHIGVVSSIAELAVQRWFKGFSQKYPLVNYEIYEGDSYGILEKLKTRVIDVAIIRRPFSARGVLTYSLAPQSLLAIGTKTYLQAWPEQITIKQLEALPLIVYRRWANILDNAFAVKGYSPRIICVAEDVRTCMSWAAAGLGVAIAPRDIWQSEPRKNLMVSTIKGLTPMAETTLVLNENGCDTAVGRAFAEYFRAQNGL